MALLSGEGRVQRTFIYCTVQRGTSKHVLSFIYFKFDRLSISQSKEESPNMLYLLSFQMQLRQGILKRIVNEISRMRTSCESVCRANKRVSKWVWWEVGQLSDLLKQRFQNNLLAELFRFAWELCRFLHKRKAMKNISFLYFSRTAPFSLLTATGI